jgi:hypothetical protein
MSDNIYAKLAWFYAGTSFQDAWFESFLPHRLRCAARTIMLIANGWKFYVRARNWRAHFGAAEAARTAIDAVRAERLTGHDGGGRQSKLQVPIPVTGIHVMPQYIGHQESLATDLVRAVRP